MIKNLREDFLYEKLPEAIIDLDERGLIQAVVGGFQDRLEDLRAYTGKLEDFYTPGAFPESGNNAILVTLTSDQGKQYTRSLEITDDTPASEGAALTAWAASQLGLSVEDVGAVRYGLDRLRLVDVNTLGYLAATLGAILYQSSLVEPGNEAAMQQRLVDSWFPRLKIKGTAQSFEVLGRILGFDDVRMTPLWSRVSPRRPDDVGNPENDPDFHETSEFVPQQALSPFYNPLETRDGPFFTWTGTVDHRQASTQFYSQVVNGFSPFIEVDVVAAQYGSVLHPATGSYALAGGDPYTAARVIPAGSGVQFRAIVDGADYNGLYVHVTYSGTGSLAVLSVTDRLSSIKYRSSYFDLGLTADMDHVAEIFGDSAVKSNKDLAAGTNTVDGIGTSPYRPWVNGSIWLPLDVRDWLTSTVETNGTSTVRVRHQAGASNSERELNVQDLSAAGVQVAQALEEVRPATRFPRRTSTGFLIDEAVPYAFYGTEAELFTTNALTSTYAGSYSRTPLPDYVASIWLKTGLFFRVYWPSTPGQRYYVDFSPVVLPVASPTGWSQIATVDAVGFVSEYFYALTTLSMAFFRVRTTGGSPFPASAQLVQGRLYPAVAAVDPETAGIWHYRFSDPLVTNISLTGSYNFETGYYYFNFNPPMGGGASSKVYAYWTLTSTEVVRPEPSYTVKRTGAVAALARPEDDEGVCSFTGSEFVNGAAYFGTYYRCLGYETIDEYPWRRDIVHGGEIVEMDAYLPVAPDLALTPVAAECVFTDHTGCEYSVYALKSTVTERMRYRIEPRPTDSTYQPGSMPIGYQGTFKNITTLTDQDRSLYNSLNDAETLMNPGYKLFHVGLVQGVLVADAPKFFGPHHRQDLICWFPLNEHPEDALEVVDHSGFQGTQYLQFLIFPNRTWDDEKGWYLNMPPQGAVTSPAYRDWKDEQTVSFWYKAGTGTGAVSTVVSAGAIRFDYDPAAQVMRGYVGSVLVGSHYVPADSWGFVYIRKTSTSAWFGAGETVIVESNSLGAFTGASDSDHIDLFAGETIMGLHDVRVWNACKTAGDMDLVRYHSPTPTIVNYPIGFMYTANHQDRYGLQVLPNGWVTTGDMPAWVRKSAQAAVRRYDEMGQYTGQSRFKETGLGGGHSLPALYQLGVQYGAMTANGTAVVSTEHGQLPGVNDLFLTSYGVGTYAASGSSALGAFRLELGVTLPSIVSNASGAAYYDATDSIFVIRNNPQQLYEYTASGALLRTITLTNFSDTEAVCWVSGSTFAILDEDLSTITVFPILPATTTINRNHYFNIDTGFGNLDIDTGGGFEGLAYDAIRDVFWIAKERQHTLIPPSRVGMRIYTVSWTGSIHEPWLAYMVLPPSITDISEIYHNRYTDTLIVLSDENKAIAEVTMDGVVREVLNYPVGMTQPEGITFDTTGTRMWLISEPNTMRRYAKGGVNGFGTYAPLLTGLESGTYSPWPNVMRETNPCRDRIWLQGQDGYVYETVLDGTLGNVGFSAQRIATLRTQSEITVNPVYDALLSTGTYYAEWLTGAMSGTLINSVGTVVINGTGGVSQTTILPLNSLGMADQPTGAEVVLAENGYGLTVNNAGLVTVVPMSGTTPPLYMYCNSQIYAFGVTGTGATSAWNKWTDRNNTYTQQKLDISPMPSLLNEYGALIVPSLGTISRPGYIEFEQSGPLVPGRYRLTVESANIGQTDTDFDGFDVEISVSTTVLNKRLLAGHSGYNIRDFDVFEFDVTESVAGKYLISFYWTNPYYDAATATKRQLAIYSYQLRRLSTQLYRLNLTSYGGLAVWQCDTSNYFTIGTPAPGGWLHAINSYGTLVAWAHESNVYSGNDTIVSKEPLSNVLTGDTCHRREDIVLPAVEVVAAEAGSFAYPIISSVTDAAWNEPIWMSSGGITPDGDAVVCARLRSDSAQVRVAVSETKGFYGSNTYYSDMRSVSTDNHWTVNCPVTGLGSNVEYYYAVEADGSLYSNYTGTFTTWDRNPRTFTFAVWACENSTALVSPAWVPLVSSNPLFMLNCGDLHYANISTNNPTLFYTAIDTVYSTGTRKDCFARVPWAYIWDDHDFGANDCDRTTASSPAARTVYRQAIPHYQLPAGDGGLVYYTFQVGRARFIVTDLRGDRDTSNVNNYLGKTMMGTAQKAWFKAEILKANADPNVAVIFWVTSVPWTGAPASDDHWCAYNDERIELSDFFKANNVTRLFLLFGDEHRQSIDDGRHTDWATGTYGAAGTGAGWPSFGCAPMGQTPSSKAAPYFIGPSNMTNPAYQFGLVTVTDDGIAPTQITFRGVYETGDTVVSAGTEVLWTFYATESPRTV